jgi:putative acetyltransferase
VTLSIRPEAPGDREAVGNVVQQAFGQPDEAPMVEALRGTDSWVLSMVADEDQEVVGHGLFTRATLEDGPTSRPVLLLCPLSVRPDRQLRAIGSELVRAGLAAAREAGKVLDLSEGSRAWWGRVRCDPAFGG